jgi:hypothetical protein
MPEICSTCGKPSRARIVVTNMDGDVLWLWAVCGACEPVEKVPVAVILQDYDEEQGRTTN